MVGNPLLTVLIDDIWVDIMQAPSWLSLLYPSTNQLISLWAYLTPSKRIHVTGISILTIKIKHSCRWIYQFHIPYFFRLHVSRCIFDGIWYIKVSHPKPSKVMGKFGFRLPQKTQPGTWPTRLPTDAMGWGRVTHLLPSDPSSPTPSPISSRSGTPWNQLSFPVGFCFPEKTHNQGPTPDNGISFRLGFFGWENTVGAKKKFWGATKNLKEYGQMIWVNLEFAYNLFACNQTALLKITPGHIFQPGSIPIRLIRFRRMLRISQDLGLGEFCIILKDDSSLGGIHSRKSYHWTLKLIGCKIGSSFFLGFFVVHDIYFRGGLSQPFRWNKWSFSEFLPAKEDNKSCFRKKKWPGLSDLKRSIFPKQRPVAAKNGGFFPKKRTHLCGRKLHILFASFQLWKAWRNGKKLMKAHSSKTKRHT